MALKAKSTAIQTSSNRRARKSKFQADVAPAEERTIRLLKEELRLSSKRRLPVGRLALLGWVASERKQGYRIIGEEVALPPVEMQWTKRELKSLAQLRAMRD